MERPSYEQRYFADEVCNEGHEKLAGQPCEECGIPPVLQIPDGDISPPEVLRPSIPEDFREAPATPPYARCVSNVTDLTVPDNAGRHPAPSDDSLMESLKDLQALRGVSGTPRGHCF